MLCNLLTQAGAGRPHSFFRVRSIPEFASFWGITPVTGETYQTAYIEAAIQAGLGGTDIFGMRTMWDSIEPLLSRFRTLYGPAKNDIAQLTDQFGPLKFIHLFREDQVSQAVSLAMAEQTGLWHRHADGTVLEQTKTPEDAAYDEARISYELEGLRTEATGWKNWFAANEITPHRLTYEALSAAPTDHLIDILNLIGMDPAIAASIRPGTARLANQINRDWATRFRRDTGLPPTQQPP